MININFFFLNLLVKVFYSGVNKNDIKGWVLDIIFVFLVGRLSCL